MEPRVPSGSTREGAFPTAPDGTFQSHESDKNKKGHVSFLVLENDQESRRGEEKRKQIIHNVGKTNVSLSFFFSCHKLLFPFFVCVCALMP